MRQQNCKLCHFDGAQTHRNGLPIENVAASVPIVKKERRRKETLFKEEIRYGATETPDGLVFTIPIRTVSEGNCFETWQKKHARHKKQKTAIALTMHPYAASIALPVRVILKRFAPRFLDVGDNLPMSMKYIRDSVASMLTGDFRPGRADGDARISWHYDQEKSKEYYIKIYILPSLLHELEF